MSQEVREKLFRAQDELIQDAITHSKIKDGFLECYVKGDVETFTLDGTPILVIYPPTVTGNITDGFNISFNYKMGKELESR